MAISVVASTLIICVLVTMIVIVHYVPTKSYPTVALFFMGGSIGSLVGLLVFDALSTVVRGIYCRFTQRKKIYKPM